MRPLAALGAILVMVGLVIYSVSVSDRRQIDAFGETPERLTLKALIERGPRGPKNVIITDYVVCENYVAEQRVVEHRFKDHEFSLERAYVPITPAVQGVDGRINTRPLQIHVVVHCPDVKDEKEIIKRCAGPELKGLVVGTVSQLDEQTRKLLAEKYPDSRFDQCIVITEGERVSPVAPPSVVRAVSLWVIGLGCVLLGIAAVLWVERKPFSHHS